MQEFCALDTVTCAEIEQKIAAPTRATSRLRPVVACAFADRIEAATPRPPWVIALTIGWQNYLMQNSTGMPVARCVALDAYQTTLSKRIARMPICPLGLLFR